ncbi:phage major capsid protein [Mycolicibacterium gilvum]|uniref:phage major capsid protein n=1 Tax=Mycolicibacterium gilvum TaxID=1804 RepID=UPI004045269B
MANEEVLRSDLNNTYLPSDHAGLVDLVVDEKSVLFQVATVLNTDKHEVRVPLWIQDPGVDFSAEGGVIPLTAGDVDELVITPVKIGARVELTNEAIGDSTPAVLDLYGKSLARSIVNKVDAQFFSSSAAVAGTSYQGLAAAAFDGVETVDTEGNAWTNIDHVHDAKGAIVANGGNPTHIVIAPDLATALAKAKQGTASNVGLFDSVQDGLQLAGLQTIVSPHLAAGEAWVFSQETLFAVRRLGTTIAKSTDAAFDRDSVQLRATTRVSWGSAAPGHIARIFDQSPA